MYAGLNKPHAKPWQCVGAPPTDKDSTLEALLSFHYWISMSPPDSSPSTTAEESSTVETRMRRALGLGGATSAQPAQRRSEPARTRPRFVRDGEVSVVVLNSSRVPDDAPNGRGAALQTALVAEQAARVAVERSLAEALATVRSLQTKLAHAELAHGEAVAAERRARERAEAVLQEMMAAHELADRMLGRAVTARETEASTPRAKVKRAAPIKPRTTTAKTREPQPVKWWLPSYKAAKQAH